MIVSNGYAIEQYVNDNKIVITLPQTLKTIKNTVTPVSGRKVKLTEEELGGLLLTVVALFGGKDEPIIVRNAAQI